MSHSWKWLLPGVSAVAVVLLMVWVMLRTTALAEDIKAITSDTNDNSRVIERLAFDIESCTTPKGKCYRDGERRTGQAVTSIGRLVTAALACQSQGNVTEASIWACVEATLPDELPPAGG